MIFLECNNCVKKKCMHKNDSIDIEESTLPSITRIFLIVTRECNLRCRYCYVEKIPLILKYYPNLRFRATADNVNVKEYFNNHKFAVENGFNHIFTTDNVFSHWTNEQKLELKNQIDLLGDYYFYLLKQGKIINISHFLGMFKKLKQLKLME